MSRARVDALKSMAEAQPEEPMIWYGLANELVKLERWDEAADALRRVGGLNADYTAAYQLLGTSLLKLGRASEARAAWTKGVEVADRAGAWKARQHMEALLAGTEEAAGGGGGLCAE